MIKAEGSPCGAAGWCSILGKGYRRGALFKQGTGVPEKGACPLSLQEDPPSLRTGLQKQSAYLAVPGKQRGPRDGGERSG